MCETKPSSHCYRCARKNLTRARLAHREARSLESGFLVDAALLDYACTDRGSVLLLRKTIDSTLPLRSRLKAARAVKEGEKLRATRDEKTRLNRWLTIDDVAVRWHGEKHHQVNISHPQVAKAFLVAVNAHKHIVRKSGEAYINHPLRTAARLQRSGYCFEVVATALMHDAVEDSDLTLQDLEAMNFSLRIITGIDSVTKRAGEGYTDAVARAAAHPIGRLVKLSDNLDNSSEEQLRPFEEAKRQKQVRKYAPARLFLMESIGNRPNAFTPSPHFSAGYRVKRSGSMTEIFA